MSVSRLPDRLTALILALTFATASYAAAEGEAPAPSVPPAAAQPPLPAPPPAADHTAELDALKQQNERQQQRIAELEQQHKSQQQSLEQLKAEQGQRQQLASQQSQMEQQLTEATQKQQSLTTQLTESQAETARLRSQVEQLTASEAALKAKLTTADGGSITAEQIIAHLTTQLPLYVTADRNHRLHPEVAEYQTQLAQITAEIDRQQYQLAYMKQARAVVRVRKGDTLAKLALNALGNGNRWRSILESNRHLIDNPDLLIPGLPLLIP